MGDDLLPSRADEGQSRQLDGPRIQSEARVKPVKAERSPKRGAQEATGADRMRHSRESLPNAGDTSAVPPDECLWTKHDVAAYLRLDARTVERMPIPRIPIMVTGKRPVVRYDPAQVKAWVDKKRTRKLEPAATARAG
jgi:hypothetical protein